VRALVLDGDSRAALAITRSLGAHEIRVAVASEERPCLAGCSCFCTETLVYPSPASMPQLFREWLCATLATMGDAVLFTCGDLTTSIVGKYRLALPVRTHHALPPQLSLEIAMDKAATIDLASRMNVPVPKTLEFKKGDIISPSDIHLRFPVVIKAAHSDLAYRPLTTYARTLDDIHIAVSDALRVVPSVLVQECVTGEGTGIFALMDSGKPLITFAHRRRYEKPPWGGTSALSESIEEPSDTLAHALDILRELKWHGVAMVEFKRDSDGTPRLMEINPRFWGSLQLAIRSGIDFPYLYSQLASGEIVDTCAKRSCAANRWVLGQVDSLISSLMTGSRPDGKSHSRFLSLLSHISSLRFGSCCEVESIADPKPALYEYAAWLRTSMNRLASRCKGGAGSCDNRSTPVV